jgi:prepilin-type N-terminal cleavage/methylation domain-containing protein
MTHASGSRGYTAVELLMAMAVLGIGVSGIIAAQKITVSSNRHSRNLALATQIARSWQDRLVADAAVWNHPSQDVSGTDLDTETEWLRRVGTGWFRPDESTSGDFGPAFDALGNPVTDTTLLARAPFCTHVRLSWLIPAAQNRAGLIRSEVRVFWLREGQGTPNNVPICDSAVTPQLVNGAVNTYHFVYLTSAVKQNQPLP